MIDSHVHLCDEKLFSQAEVILERAKAVGVDKLVIICTNPVELERGMALQEKFQGLYLVGSTTPHEAHLLGDQDFATFERAAREKKMVGLGETGLEYFHHPETKEVQKALCERYFRLAQELSLPLVIHCREAFEDLFCIISRFPQVKGVLHCFTGAWQEAKTLIGMGWMISLSGIVTFKKSTALQAVARQIPLSHLLIETDAPYLAPQSKRGKVNEPSYLPEINDFIAHLRNEDIQSTVEENTNNFFGIYM